MTAGVSCFINRPKRRRMQFKTTPSTQFENLFGYDFKANYVEVGDGLKMHYVDEGKSDGAVVLLLHGEPSWSYLYRKMIPLFVKAGYRAIAPDLIGFGKSDKPTAFEDYSYAKHLKWTWSLIEQLDLTNINLFCQDWGGLLGLRFVAEHSERFARIVASNTMLPTGDVAPNEAFKQWQQFSQTAKYFDIGRVLQNGTASELSPEVVAAYNAPYPDDTYKAGARIFPSLVPTTSDDPQTENNRAAWMKLGQFDKPFLTLFGDSDPITGGLDKIFHKLIPGAKEQAHETIKGGGHFIQEEKGEELATKMIAFMQAN